MPIIKFASQRQSQLHKRNTKIAEVLFDVVDWQKANGGNYSQMIKDLKSFMKANFGKREKDMVFALNANIWILDTDKKGKSFWRNLDWYMSGWEYFDEVDFSKVWLDSITDAHIKRFYLYIRASDEWKAKNQKAGTDEHNDCVFNAILQAHNYKSDKLPKVINKAWKLKKYFEYERNDKLDIMKIIPKLEELLKCTIEVYGDITHSPAEKKAKNIKLKLKNEHVTLMNNEGKLPTLRYDEVTKENIFSYYDDLNSNECTIYRNGAASSSDSENDEQLRPRAVETETIKYEELTKLKSDYKYITIKVKDIDELKTTVKEYIKKADYFKKFTKGFINYYKSQYVGYLAFEQFRRFSKAYTTPPELTNLEHIALSEANVGGIHYAEAGEFEDCTDYDMNMMYMHYMMQNALTLPTKPGEEMYMTMDEINKLKFFPHGLYYCKITGNSKFITMSMCMGFKWHTHFILTIAMKEKMKIELKEGNEINAIVYKTDRVCAKALFEEYGNWAINLRNEIDTEYEKEAKLFTSCLWGFLSRSNKKVKRYHPNESIDIDGMDIEHLRPLETGGCVIKYNKRVKKLKTSYARFGCFITSFCRLQLYNILEKNKIDLDNIKVINTDGFLLQYQKLPKELIGTKPGQFKIAKDKSTQKPRVGACVVHHSNSYSFI
jgi:hypothetical protein